MKRPHENPQCSCEPCLMWQAKEELRPLPGAHRFNAALAMWKSGLFTSREIVQFLLDLNREPPTDDTGENPVKPV